MALCPAGALGRIPNIRVLEGRELPDDEAGSGPGWVGPRGDSAGGSSDQRRMTMGEVATPDPVASRHR